jgi:hypothetical protein
MKTLFRANLRAVIALDAGHPLDAPGGVWFIHFDCPRRASSFTQSAKDTVGNLNADIASCPFKAILFYQWILNGIRSVKQTFYQGFCHS